MQFKYNFQEIHRDKLPLIDVVLKNKENGKIASCRALLDSGGFMTILHEDIANVLGIDLSKIKYVSFNALGKSGEGLKGRPYIVELQVNKRGKGFSFDAYVLFSSDFGKDQLDILGRSGFFDKFDEITFNFKANKFYLTTNK